MEDLKIIIATSLHAVAMFGLFLFGRWVERKELNRGQKNLRKD